MRTPGALLGLLALPGLLAAAGEVDYLRDVKPVLGRRCYACHGALKQNAKLRLDTAASLVRGGQSGPAAVPGQSDDSLIVDMVSGPDGERMPPEGEPLSAQRNRPRSRPGSTRGPRPLPTSRLRPTRETTGRFARPGAPRFRRSRYRTGPGTRSTPFSPPGTRRAGSGPGPRPTAARCCDGSPLT